MNFLNRIKIITSKELKDFLRDRKTIITLLLGPLFIVFFVPSLFMLSGVPTMDTPISVGVINTSDAPDFVYILQQNQFIKLYKYNQTSNISEALNSNKLDIILSFSPNFSRNVREENNATVNVYRNSGNIRSTSAIILIDKIIENYQDEIVHHNIKKDYRLTDEEVNSTLNPVHVTYNDCNPNVSDIDSSIAGLLFLIPFFIIFWGGTSVFGVIADLITGEKERKTLEPLLSLPINRMDIVCGKYLTIFTINCVLTVPVVCLSLFALFSALSVIMEKMGLETGLINVNKFSILIMIILFTLYLGFISAIIMVPSFIAKNFKQASVLTSPIYIAVVLLAVSTVYIPTATVSILAVPVVGIVSAMNIVLVDSIGILELSIVISTSLVYIIICILFSSLVFSCERTIFRE